MTTGRHHSVEIGDGAATLVLFGALSTRDVFSVRRACRDIPHRIRTLRLDLVAVTQFDDGVMEAVHGVVRDWRRSRDGDCRLDLTASHLIARLEDRRAVTNMAPSAHLALSDAVSA